MRYGRSFSLLDVPRWMARARSTVTPMLLAAVMAIAGCKTGGRVGADAGAGDSGAGGGDGGCRATCGSLCCGAGEVCEQGACHKDCGGVAPRCGEGLAEACCFGADVCHLGHCVTPGRACQDSTDCPKGQYCEASGAAADGGSEIPDAGACAPPVAHPGHCFDLPPECGADGGAGCIHACTHRPPPGNLDAVPLWSWGPVASTAPDFTDVWSTPAVGRIADANCDGKVNELDPPNIVFVSGNAEGVCCGCNGAAVSTCHTGVLRMLDGRSGAEVWSLERAEAGSVGFMGLSVAIGDLDGDGWMDIAAVTGEGYLVVVDHAGKVTRRSDLPIPGAAGKSFGWGGALAIADMDGDGHPEIAYGSTVFTTAGGALTLRFSGVGGGAESGQEVSLFADLDLAPDGNQELLSGRTAWRADGNVLWSRSDLKHGFPAVGDLDGDGKPEVVFVSQGQVWVLDGASGQTKSGPFALAGTGSGGPPTIADFDGDGKPEIGVAQANFYSVLKPAAGQLTQLWTAPNHDLSSSVTGSTVFDFDGDGRAEVIYGDECFLWVYDGPTGAVKFATPHTSFTATEASLVADIDGDGHAEMLMVSNGANPGATGWKCDVAPWNQPDPVTGRPAWAPPPGATAWRGLVAFGDRQRGWVGTRTLWNQHAYHVTNVCDGKDGACAAGAKYGAIPARERKSWAVPWLNSYRQNVQEKGIFDVPDLVVADLAAENGGCPAALRLSARVANQGKLTVRPGLPVAFYEDGSPRTLLAVAHTAGRLGPGEAEVVTAVWAPAGRTGKLSVVAVADDDGTGAGTTLECREDNNASAPITTGCSGFGLR